jgi:transposase InsO family protein
VLDTFSRRVVGWSIDATPTAALATNALGPARQGFWAGALDGQRRRLLRQRHGRAFWSRMQVELLDRHRWRTRVELANAIFEYLEIFHNRQRRHSSLGMLTPIEFESTSTVA